MNDYRQHGEATLSAKVSAIADDIREKAKHSTEPVWSAPNVFSGMKYLGRVRDISRTFRYSEALANDMKLFMSLLLFHMPLYRVRKIWSPKDCAWRLPATAYSSKFHRCYSQELAVMLGTQPSLTHWYKVFYALLLRKFPENKANELEWKDFYITPAEIHFVVVESTFHYVFERAIQT